MNIIFVCFVATQHASLLFQMHDACNMTLSYVMLLQTREIFAAYIFFYCGKKNVHNFFFLGIFSGNFSGTFPDGSN
jgi:hypothetical protein